MMKPSHILLFVIDDYGFSDASYKATMYNGTAPPPTPHIDKLAMAGVRLESHYVNKLCSPTRTALLSGRYAYTNGMDDGVIVDGQNIDMPLNLKTVGDWLQEAGWKTSAYGKWDAGMTVWGSTPTCRGFDHFDGFYSAASDYFTHRVGPGFDYHCDTAPEPNVSGVYTTHVVTEAVQRWITTQVTENSDATSGGGLVEHVEGLSGGGELKTFAYVAHEAVHGPMEVPEQYIRGSCDELVPADHPTRKIYCGMVRAVDESVGNISATYTSLGLGEKTLFILTGDNGGIPQDGGYNTPLRGNKATTFEGGVRSIAFVSGAGLAAAVRGTVTHALIHVTDWLPTLVGGVAGISLASNTTGRACPTCTRAVAPLDGVDQWPMLSLGAPSARHEVLLDLQATARNQAANQAGTTRIPGSGAIRVGRWKLLHGHQGVWPGRCTERQPRTTPKSFPIPVPPNETNPWCPYGWVSPPRTGGGYTAPEPPPEAASWPNCTAGQLPCDTPPSAGYVAGQTLLFDVVADMEERHDVAAANPTIVAQLLARLQSYNDSHCGGARCLPDDAGGKRGEPSGHAGPGGIAVWLPWRGSPDPLDCDTNRTAPPDPTATVKSNLDPPKFASLSPPKMQVVGWCWDAAWSGGGVPPMTVRLSVDGDVTTAYVVANVSRAGLPSKTGAPNPEHGFVHALPPAAAAKLAGKGTHKLDVDVYLDGSPASAHAPTMPVKGSPVCFRSGAAARCPGEEAELSIEAQIAAFVDRN